MIVRIGRSQLDEAQRLNYSTLLYLVHGANEIKASIGSPRSGVLELTISVDQLRKRLLDYAGNVFGNVKPHVRKIALPVLIYDNKLSSPIYDPRHDSIDFRDYETPRRACVVCGICMGSKKEYQEVSLRADYKQRPLDPLSRGQISAVCPFCFHLAKATSSINGVWEVRRDQLELYQSLLTKNFFGNLSFTLKRDLQFVMVPIPGLGTTLFSEAKTFAKVLNQILLGRDIYTDIYYWCPERRERDYPHLLMAILERAISEEVEEFVLFERRKRGRKWSTEHVYRIRKQILQRLRSYIFHKRETRLDLDTSRQLAKVVRALIDGDLITYYATLSGGLPHGKGSFINNIFNKDIWDIKSSVEHLRKNLIMLR